MTARHAKSKSILPELSLDGSACRDLSHALELEWLETNGLGGYASSTVAGANTRRYHGLLVAAQTPPTGRTVMLNKLDETVRCGNDEWQLGCNLFPGATHPSGHELIESFHLDPFPRWVFRLGPHRLEKTVFMVYARNAVALCYRWVDGQGRPLDSASAPNASLRLRPFISFRDFHHIRRENPYLDSSCVFKEDSLTLRPYWNMPVLTILHHGFYFESSPHWHYNFEYPRERERGLDFQEDLFSHGELARPDMGASCCVLAFMGKASRLLSGAQESPELETFVSVLRDKEVMRRRRLLNEFKGRSDTVRRLVLAADQFIAERGGRRNTIIAGYHWFNDWGRDTMIAYPGIALTAKRLAMRRATLQAYAGFVKHGLIPNNFPDTGFEPSYNSVDATLWFFNAGSEYAENSGDYEFAIQELWPVFQDIIAHFRRGTLFDIRMDEDGLITAGSENTQLTWMDACVDGVPMTPRYGKVVEINALWHNALRVAATLAARAGQDPAPYSELADKTRDSFNAVFWNPAAGCLFDTVSDHGSDSAIRPNQLAALSLPHALLDSEKAESVLRSVEERLLTPVGLRSLDPADSRYCGRYAGGVAERDGAYHQGAVWGWLMGLYARALRNVRGDDAARTSLSPLYKSMKRHITTEACLNSVSEIFDGDPPHASRGCVAQAWSVGEWLYIADFLEPAPHPALHK